MSGQLANVPISKITTRDRSRLFQECLKNLPLASRQRDWESPAVLCCDITLPEPGANLALDEALLDQCEGGFPHPILRFWSPATFFVVVGYANQVALEVNVPACEGLGVPVFRRCTGGGTVLQGPGCLNYSVILKMDSDPLLGSITGTNGYVMERNRAALESVLRRPVELAGHTDLAIAGRKFCGNAQRRRREWLIFHGCFLLDCDLELMEKVLRMPSKRPDYRQDRRHKDFITNLHLPPESLKAALRQAWGSTQEHTRLPLEASKALARDRYSRPEWNLKF